MNNRVCIVGSAIGLTYGIISASWTCGNVTSMVQKSLPVCSESASGCMNITSTTV